MYIKAQLNLELLQDENYEWYTAAKAKNDKGWKCKMKFQIEPKQIGNEYLQK